MRHQYYIARESVRRPRTRDYEGIHREIDNHQDIKGSNQGVYNQATPDMNARYPLKEGRRRTM
jgi:hypothetical protein